MLFINTKNHEELANELFESYKPCFCADSTEKWIKMFCEKRLETIDVLLEEEGKKPMTKAFKKKVINSFTEQMLQYIAKCKKERRKKEREALDRERENMKQVKRKKGK